MAKLRKREWNPRCHRVAGEFNIRWQHLILLWFMYIVQLYKEDWTILRVLDCRAVALPSTEQIVPILIHQHYNSLGAYRCPSTCPPMSARFLHARLRSPRGGGRCTQYLSSAMFPSWSLTAHITLPSTLSACNGTLKCAYVNLQIWLSLWFHSISGIQDLDSII